MNNSIKSSKKWFLMTLIFCMLFGMFGGGTTTVVNADVTVYVTRTGSKYHTGKCGNGTYYESSLTSAKARGLTACKKCFGSGDAESSDSYHKSTGASNKQSDYTSKEKIEISSNDLTLIVGQSKTLKISGTKSQAEWKSNNNSIAKVSSNGKVTAKKKGNATITAQVNTQKLTCKVKVESPQLSEKKMVMNPDDEKQIKLKGCTHDVEWSVVDTDVAEVDDGYIYSYDKGTTIIKAQVHGKTYKCTLMIEDGSEDATHGESD